MAAKIRKRGRNRYRKKGIGQRRKKGLNRTGKMILAVGKRSRYDTEAISIFKDRQYLARILKDCTTEFHEMSVEEIIPCIEPPEIGTIPVEPGLTGAVLRGDPTESKIIGEGVLTYDVRFRAVAPGRRPVGIRMLFDVELQQKENPGYDLVPRGILYIGRMLSEQMTADVSGSHYDALQKVYSIWICLNCALKRAYTISRYSIRHEAVYGEFKEAARSDLLQVILIRLPAEGRKRKPRNKPTELMKLLEITFSRKMSATGKLTRISGFGITVTQELEGRVNTMCNLSQGLIDEGRKAGRKEGRKEGHKEGRIVEAVDIYRTEMGLDDESIIRKICDKYSLTNDRAQAYVRGKSRSVSTAV